MKLPNLILPLAFLLMFGAMQTIAHTAEPDGLALENMVGNPGFEIVDYGAWSASENLFTGAEILPDESHSGKNAMSITARKYPYSGARQEVALEMGKTYYVSAWVKLAEGGVAKISLDGLEQDGIVEREVPANTWTLLAGEITPTTATGYSHLLIHTTESLADLWVDDVSLTPKVDFDVTVDNLLVNPAFATGTTDPWSSEPPSKIEVVEPETAGRSYSALVSHRTKARQGIKQSMPMVKGGKVYEVSALVRLLQSEDVALVGIEYVNSKGIRKTEQVPGRVSEDNWGKIAGRIKLEDDISDATFFVRLTYSVSNMYVDNLECREFAPIEIGEVMKNTTFEQGDVRGWEATRWAKLEVKDGVAHGGRYAAEVSAREHSYAGARQSLNVEGGKSYDLSAWVKLPEADKVRVLIEHAGGGAAVVEADVKADTWTRVEGRVLLPGGAISGAQFVVCTEKSLANFLVDDLACKEVTTEKLDPVGGVIKNGGFEEQASWIARDAVFQILPSIQYAGKQSGLLKNRQSHLSALWQALPLANGKAYELSAWVKLGDKSDNIIASLEYEVGGEKRRVSFSEYCSSGEWSQMRGIASINEVGDISDAKILFHTEESEADIHIDSISLNEVKKTVKNENLLKNGDFEDSLNNWQSVANGVLTSVPGSHLGRNAVKISGREHPWYSVRQPVTMEPGVAYQMSAWIKLSDGPTQEKASARLIMEYLADGSPSSESVTVDISSGKWTYVNTVVTCPVSTVENAMFTICTSDFLGDIIVDDATFRKIVKNDDPIIDQIGNDSLAETTHSLLRNVVLENGRHYTVSGKLSADAPDTIIMGLEYFLDGVKKTKEIQKSVTQDNPVVIKGTLETEASGEIVAPAFFIRPVGGSTKVRVSDVVFNDETTSNGDFEEPLENNSWQGRNALIVPEHVHVYSNRSSLRVTARETSEGALQHDIGVGSNKSYTVSAMVKTSGANDIGQVGFEYTADGVPKQKIFESPINALGFTRIGGQINLGGETGKIEDARLIVKTKNGRDDFTADDVSCTTDEVVVTGDLNSDLRVPNYQSSGFLHGFEIDGEEPPDYYITQLKPMWHRLGVWYGNWNRAIMTNRLGIKIQNVVPNYADIIGGTQTRDEKVRTLVEKSNRELTNSKTYWDLFNEYSLIPPKHAENSPEFFKAWTEEFDRVKKIDPNAKIVGPSMEFFHLDILKGFLLWAKGAKRLPDLISWHFSDDTVHDVARLRVFMAENDMANIPLSMNEFMLPHELTSSVNAWYLARNERANVNANASNWSGSHILCDTIRKDAEGNWKTRGRWWAYKRYADMTGMLVNTEASAALSPKVEILASKDNHRTVRALLGKKSYLSNFSTGVKFKAVSAAPYIAENGLVRVVVERIPNGFIKSPIVIIDTNVAVMDDGLSFTFPWNHVFDSYAITLSKPGSIHIEK